MNKVLFFARDPGGANCIIPIIREVQRNQNYIDTVVLAKDIAFKRIESSGITVDLIDNHCIPSSIMSIRRHLEDSGYNAVVTGTSVDDYTERNIWKACAELNIPSIAILDQWTNLGIRFSRYDYSQEKEYKKNHSHDFFPSIICVMDELAKKMMIQEGVPETLIMITGQPHFDTVKFDYDNTPSIRAEGESITFVSEPIYRDYDSLGKDNYWGFNEFSIFEELLSAFRTNFTSGASTTDKVRIIIRPHPRDDVGEWVRRIKYIEDFEVSVDSKSSTYELFRKSSLICGMSSMMLLEAAICGIPMMSIMIGLKRENPFVLNNIGLCPTITDKAVLEKELRLFLEGKIEAVGSFSYITNATDNVIRCLKEVLENGKISN